MMYLSQQFKSHLPYISLALKFKRLYLSPKCIEVCHMALKIVGDHLPKHSLTRLFRMNMEHDFYGKNEILHIFPINFRF
jgi:hypothetical protein